MIRLMLVRHGVTQWNQDGRYQGQVDVPLSDEGRRQAAALRDRLRAEQFTACYTSTLSRACETAAIVLGTRPCPRHETPDLNEMNYGQWEGLLRAEIMARYPDAWARYLQDPERFPPPGGETHAQLLARVRRAMEAITLKHAGEEATVLIVAHGGSLRDVVAMYLRIGHDHLWKLRQDNTGLTIIDLFPDGGELSLFNDTAHLGPSKARPMRQPAH